MERFPIPCCLLRGQGTKACGRQICATVQLGGLLQNYYKKGVGNLQERNIDDFQWPDVFETLTAEYILSIVKKKF